MFLLSVQGLMDFEGVKSWPWGRPESLKCEHGRCKISTAWQSFPVHCCCVRLVLLALPSPHHLAMAAGPMRAASALSGVWGKKAEMGMVTTLSTCFGNRCQRLLPDVPKWPAFSRNVPAIILVSSVALYTYVMSYQQPKCTPVWHKIMPWVDFTS